LEDVAAGVALEVAGEFSIATATYKGSGKKFLQQIAEQLEVPTEIEDDKGRVKQLTLDQLKDEIMLRNKNLITLASAK